MLTRKFGTAAKCFIARDLASGLRMAHEQVMDITLVDLCLPDATVDQVIEAIPLFTHPVIIVTDLDDANSEIEVRCYEHCAQNFFSKHALRREIFDHTGSSLVSAITKAHWRDRLPQRRKEREAAAATQASQSQE